MTVRRSPRLWLASPTADTALLCTGAIVLAVVYLFAHFHDPALPGADTRFPLGWNGWFDQGNYHKSAFSLAHGELDAERHWYPLGYPLTGALFARLMPADCFAVPDLICLLACLVGFVTFCSAGGVARTASVPLFVFATTGSASLRHVWSQPWNTTLSAALIWWLLAVTARLLRRDPLDRRVLVGAAGAGALCACLVETRPTDALLVAVWSAALLLLRLRSRTPVLAPAAAVLAGAAVLLVPYLWLYLTIYGAHPTPYMRLSAGIGFGLKATWWKTYQLLITPRPWFPHGAGLLERLPWLAAGLAGILALPFLGGERRSPFMLLSALILTTWTSFFLYEDLQPTGLWLFENVHYFKWTFPGLLLLGYVAVRNLPVRPFPVAASALLVLLATSVHLLPAPAGPDARAWMIQVPQTPPGFFRTYFGTMSVRSPGWTAVNTRDFRSVPDDQGLRFVLSERPLAGPLSLDSRIAGIPSGPLTTATRWGIAASPGLPCWLPPYVCDRRMASRTGFEPVFPP